MSRATGRPQIKAPHLPTGFIYDLPSLLPPPNNVPTINPAPIVYAITPRGSKSPIQSPDSSAVTAPQSSNREATTRDPFAGVRGPVKGALFVKGATLT